MKAYRIAELQNWRREHPEHDLILYGAGDLGKLALEVLHRADVRVTAFYDDSKIKQGTFWRGVPIVSNANLSVQSRRSRILLSMNYLSVVTAKLDALGFQDIGTCARLFEDADLSGVDVGVHSLEISRKVAWHRRECAKYAGGNDLTLKYVDVVITEACSMKCTDCSNLMQYYNRPRNADFDALCSEIDRLLDAVDWIDEIRVLGGEPLINKRFADILWHLAKHANFRHLVVYTNATIMPDVKILQALSDPRVTVNITDYGRLSRRLEQFVAAVKAAGVAYLVKQPSWTDSGRIQAQTKTPAELDAQFKQCCVNDILTLLHGRIYRCPFSANLANLGAVPAGPEESVVISEDRNQLRNGLRKLYVRGQRLTACGFCNGRDHSTPKIPAAIQVSQPLPLPDLHPPHEIA